MRSGALVSRAEARGGATASSAHASHRTATHGETKKEQRHSMA